MSKPPANDSCAERLVRQPGQTSAWNEAWRGFYEQFAETIIAYARRRGLDADSARDVLQEVMATVIYSQHGKVAGYRPESGAFRAWIWGVIRHRLQEAFRRLGETPLPAPREADGEERTDDGGDGMDPPPDYAEMEERQWELSILDAAMKRAQARVGAQNFAIFISLLKEDAAPEDLARKTGITRNNIDAIKHRCKNMVIIEARHIREEWECLRQLKVKL
jgi:RNA polymerase sigma factor (sigma-70 family)